jgi:hypothetical protein
MTELEIDTNTHNEHEHDKEDHKIKTWLSPSGIVLWDDLYWSYHNLFIMRYFGEFSELESQTFRISMNNNCE